jgi:peptide deformylase
VTGRPRCAAQPRGAFTEPHAYTDDASVGAAADWVADALEWLAGTDGRVRPAVRSPDPVLAMAGDDVDPTDPDVGDLAADLVATMAAAPGCVGLAAQQIGVAARVLAIDVRNHPKTRTCHGLVVLCNADIVAASQWQKGREGCLSIPDLTGDVMRAGRLVVAARLPGGGRPVTLTTDAFEARALQHEIDHCAGALFLDRVAGPHAIFARKVYR